MNKKQLNKPKLKLIKRKDAYDGYTLSNIKEALGPRRFAEFEKWLFGQTVGVHKDESLVYQHDFIRFLTGSTIFD